MTKHMLIDAAHPEETRVVVQDDLTLVEFDFESSTKRQLKGNIYLAKVTRVEPSLQAAFVEYGGNRHGFLPFSEIHPDYYQVPAADRAQLEKHEQELANAAAAADAENGNGNGGSEVSDVTHDPDEETADVVDEQARGRARLLRSYKIQEVVKRRQIMLVQVVKEERGNKGAALTTYLSLAGRYCVLMPNTPRGGGISRKIASAADRKRLKAIAAELEVPKGMGLIIRTAGAERTRAEIKRDYEYLIRLWDEIRETTLQSIAPALIYEEGDLIKRALRDLYTRDIEEILVEGEEGYRNARRLMQMLMPSRVRLIKQYTDDVPLFFRHQVEEELEKIYNPIVQLPSGGSLVIHTTEALTAIDVNSGRSTRERHIDETAIKTNLEAADEVARQLRLRDLAGLIVIDFIDMAESRHQRAVEKRLRDALKADRARIQLGKISVFGLMELSRQRLRPSLMELSTRLCSTCGGSGVVRSTESCALQALRQLLELGIKGETTVARVNVPMAVALYLLNQKRDSLVRLEQRYAMQILVEVDEHLHPPHVEIEVVEKREQASAPDTTSPVATPVKTVPLPEPEPEEAVADDGHAHEEDGEHAHAEDGEDHGRKRRRRRRRRRRNGEVTGAPTEQPPIWEREADSLEAEQEEAEPPAALLEPQEREPEPAGVSAVIDRPPPLPAEEPAAASAPEVEPQPEAEAVAVAPEEKPSRPRRRRAPRKEAAEAAAAVAPEGAEAEQATPASVPAAEAVEPAAAKPARPRRRAPARKAAPATVATEPATDAPAPQPTSPEPVAAEPDVPAPTSPSAPAEEERELATTADSPEEPRRGARQGWWRRWTR